MSFVKTYIIKASFCAALVFYCGTAIAQDITPKTDPVFTPMYENAPHPLEELFFLARSGDGRAQFILADLYLKGKGGVSENRDAALSLLEHSAKNGEDAALARLGAIAEANDDKAKAYGWYTVLQRSSKDRSYKKWAKGKISTLGFTQDERDEAKAWLKTWADAPLETVSIPDSVDAPSKKPASRPTAIEDTPSPNADIVIPALEDDLTEQEIEPTLNQSIKESFND